MPQFAQAFSAIIKSQNKSNKEMKCKVYGERNSSTHYVIRLLKKNFKCEMIPGTLADAKPGYRDIVEGFLKTHINDKKHIISSRQTLMDRFFSKNFSTTLGWKHGVPSIDMIEQNINRQQVLFVTVVKNPYAWALSLYRRPYDYLDSEFPSKFTEFITKPWHCLKRDNTYSVLKSPIELWNLKTQGYFNLEKQFTTLCFSYEDILKDPHEFLLMVSQYLNKKGGKFETQLDATKKKDMGKNSQYYQDYYLNERWKEELSEEDIDNINKYLNPLIVKQAGYEMITKF